MVMVERSNQLMAAPHEVWAVLADFGAISNWAPNVDHSCVLSDSPTGVGTVRRIQSGRATVLETVTVWEPDAVLSYTISGLPPVIRSVSNSWSLVATDVPGASVTGAGTEVTLTTTVEPGPLPPHKLAARVAGRTLSTASDQMLGGLAVFLSGSLMEESSL